MATKATKSRLTHSLWAVKKFQSKAHKSSVEWQEQKEILEIDEKGEPAMKSRLNAVDAQIRRIRTKMSNGNRHSERADC